MELSQAGQDKLESQNIRIYQEVKIGRKIDNVTTWTTIQITGHSLSYDKEFGAAVLDFSVANSNGDYCREALSSINYVDGVYKPLFDDENLVIFRQGFINDDNEIEWIEEEASKGRFNGTISQVREGYSSIQVVCHDNIKKFTTNPPPGVSYSPTIYEVEGEVLNIDYTSGNDAYKVFSFAHPNIVPVPGPVLYVSENGEKKELDTEYYEVNQYNGKAVFYEIPFDSVEIESTPKVLTDKTLSHVTGTYQYVSAVSRFSAKQDSNNGYQPVDSPWDTTKTITVKINYQRPGNQTVTVSASDYTYAYYNDNVNYVWGIVFNDNPINLLPEAHRNFAQNITIVASWTVKQEAGGAADKAIIGDYYYYGNDAYAEDILIDVARRSGFDNVISSNTITLDQASSNSVQIPECPQQLWNGNYFISASLNRVKPLTESDNTDYDNRFTFDPASRTLDFGADIQLGDTLYLSYCDPGGEELYESKNSVEMWNYPRAENYNGIDYTADKIYVSPNYPYENWVSGNVAFQDGETPIVFSDIDHRSGKVYFSSAPGSIVTSTYQAFTIKGTGISLPAIEFPYADFKTGHDAIQEIRKAIAPNYLIYADSTGKCRANYSWQKGSPQIIEYGTDITGGTINDGTTYLYGITAYDANGETLLSREVRIIADKGTNTQKNWIWIEPLTGATGYKLYRRGDGKAFAADSLIADQAGTYFEDAGNVSFTGNPPSVATAFLGYDHKLVLIKDVSPQYQDEEVFTHVVAKGVAFSIENTARRSGTEITRISNPVSDSSYPSADDLKKICDNDVDTYASWLWNDIPPYPIELFKIKLDQPYYLDSVHLYAKTLPETMPFYLLRK